MPIANSHWILLMALTFISPCRANSPIGPTNLAFNKRTNQSSTDNTAVSERAVDGNTNMDFSVKSCSHTTYGYPSWWLVDLEGIYFITSVRITNVVGQPERLTNFTVEVSMENPGTLEGFPDLTESPVCFKVNATHSLSGSTSEFFTCDEPIIGRYLRIVKYNAINYQRSLVLCEVEVFNNRFDVALKTMAGVQSSVKCAVACLTEEESSDDTKCQLVVHHSSSGTCVLLMSSIDSEIGNVTTSKSWTMLGVSGVQFDEDRRLKSMRFAKKG